MATKIYYIYKLAYLTYILTDYRILPLFAYANRIDRVYDSGDLGLLNRIKFWRPRAIKP
jgi:hypothetical protein